jgi:hypothetical protein
LCYTARIVQAALKYQRGPEMGQAAVGRCKQDVIERECLRLLSQERQELNHQPLKWMDDGCRRLTGGNEFID